LKFGSETSPDSDASPTDEAKKKVNKNSNIGVLLGVETNISKDTRSRNGSTDMTSQNENAGTTSRNGSAETTSINGSTNTTSRNGNTEF
jgi:hypothetical protein